MSEKKDSFDTLYFDEDRTRKLPDVLSEPFPAWSRYQETPLRIVVLPFSDYYVLDHDGWMKDDLVKSLFHSAIAGIVTDRGFQLIFPDHSLHDSLIDLQDSAYYEIAKARNSWSIRTRSKSGNKKRILIVIIPKDEVSRKNKGTYQGLEQARLRDQI